MVVSHAWPQWIAGWAAAAVLALAAGAGAAPEVAVSPASLSVTVGTEFDLSLVANAELPPLSCYAITVEYDDTQLELVSGQEGDLFAGSGLPTFFSQEADGDDDVWTNCVLGFGTSVAPPGELVRLRFRALKDGVTDVVLADLVLRDVDRATIPGVGAVHGQVTAGATATPPPVLAAALRMVAFPNPSSGPVRLDLELDRAKAEGFAGDARDLLEAGTITLFDLSGRRVRRLTPAAGGGQWDGRDAQGRRVASGTYLAVFEHPADLRLVTKLVRFE